MPQQLSRAVGPCAVRPGLGAHAQHSDLETNLRCYSREQETGNVVPPPAKRDAQDAERRGEGSHLCDVEAARDAIDGDPKPVGLGVHKRCGFRGQHSPPRSRLLRARDRLLQATRRHPGRPGPRRFVRGLCPVHSVRGLSQRGLGARCRRREKDCGSHGRAQRLLRERLQGGHRVRLLAVLSSPDSKVAVIPTGGRR